MTNCPKCNTLIEDGHSVCLECGTIVSERETSVLVRALQVRVSRFLQRAGVEYTERDGEFLLTRGSAGIVVSSSEFDGHVFLDFHGAVASNIQLNPEQERVFYQKLLTWNLTDELGKFAVLDDQVILKYKMLAEEVSFDSFWHVVDTILEYADLLDEQVAEMSHGKRHVDTVTAS